MASGTFFVRSCPTCGRSLEVRVELLGKQVECVHCGANFAANEEPVRHQDDVRIDQILARAQQYIDSVATVDRTAAKGF